MQKILRDFMVIFMLVLIVMLISLLNGCSQQTVMQKLQSNQRYDELNNVFWGKELDSHTPLWNEAVNYCENHGEKPNCGPVLQLYIVSQGTTKIVPYGTSGNYLHVPDF